jgi:hypothetical protein
MWNTRKPHDGAANGPDWFLVGLAQAYQEAVSLGDVRLSGRFGPGLSRGRVLRGCSIGKDTFPTVRNLPRSATRITDCRCAHLHTRRRQAGGHAGRVDGDLQPSIASLHKAALGFSRHALRRSHRDSDIPGWRTRKAGSIRSLKHLGELSLCQLVWPSNDGNSVHSDVDDTHSVPCARAALTQTHEAPRVPSSFRIISPPEGISSVHLPYKSQ